MNWGHDEATDAACVHDQDGFASAVAQALSAPRGSGLSRPGAILVLTRSGFALSPTNPAPHTSRIESVFIPELGGEIPLFRRNKKEVAADKCWDEQ